MVARNFKEHKKPSEKYMELLRSSENYDKFDMEGWGGKISRFPDRVGRASS